MGSSFFPTILVVYAAIECVFFLYYLKLKRQVQAPGPPSRHSRRYLRSVFSRALAFGLDDEHRLAVDVSAKTTALSNGDQKSRQQPRSQSRPAVLRAESFIPAYMSTPLEKNDPRAIEFAKVSRSFTMLPSATVSLILFRSVPLPQQAASNVVQA